MTNKTPNPGQSRPRPRRRKAPVDTLAQVRDLLLAPVTAKLSSQARAAQAEQEQRRRADQQRLARRVERETKALSERITALSRRLAKTSRQQEKTIADLRRQVEHSAEENRGNLERATTQAHERLTAMLVAMEGRLNQTIDEVRQGKTDRSALAALFEDFAQRVSGSKPKSR